MGPCFPSLSVMIGQWLSLCIHSLWSSVIITSSITSLPVYILYGAQWSLHHRRSVQNAWQKMVVELEAEEEIHRWVTSGQTSGRPDSSGRIFRSLSFGLSQDVAKVLNGLTEQQIKQRHVVSHLPSLFLNPFFANHLCLHTCTLNRNWIEPLVSRNNNYM